MLANTIHYDDQNVSLPPDATGKEPIVPDDRKKYKLRCNIDL